MTTPMATIADALIEFILGLLGDPEAAAEFAEDPEGAFEAAGLGDICAADVRSVAPVVIDRPEVISVSAPDVTVNTPPTIVFRPPHPEEPKHELIREIANIVNNFSFDNRATILDQSVNQSIWAEGDVTQLFDQDAVVAAGDESVAGGENVDIDNSTTDIEAGDISIGNTDTDVEIEDSFNDESVDVELDLEADVEDSANDQSSTVEQDVSVEDSFNESTETTIDGSTVVNAPASTPQVEESAAAAAEPVQEVADYAAETTPDSSLDTIDSISDSPEYTDEALIEEQPLDAEFDDQP
ncbi:MAG: IniB N-terminal domain-containing protein [Dermatophilaceae bacterium]|nr:IniB N-terminal domain-containing protein [Dermatophilaceae bacterium]